MAEAEGGGLPSLAGQPSGSGLTDPPPANRGGPLGLREAEVEAPPHLMCPRFISQTDQLNTELT